MDYRGPQRGVVLGLGLTGLSRSARHLAARMRRARARRRHARRAAARRTASAPSLPDGRARRPGPFTAATFARRRPDRDQPGRARKDQPAIAAAVARGAELVGDIELFARALPPGQKVLAITGTNGKTTVTALTGALCRAAGLSTRRRRQHRRRRARRARARSTQAARRGPTCSCSSCRASSSRPRRRSRRSPRRCSTSRDNHLDRYAGIADYAPRRRASSRSGGVQVLNRDDPRSCG